MFVYTAQCKLVPPLDCSNDNQRFERSLRCIRPFSNDFHPVVSWVFIARPNWHNHGVCLCALIVLTVPEQGAF